MSVTSHPYQSDFARRYFDRGHTEGVAQGRALGEARAVLAILEAREIEVTAEVRTKILECTDLAQLDAWVRQALTVSKADELLNPTTPTQ